MIARLRGYRVALHHHVYAYANRQDWRLKCVDRIMGKTGLHIVLCDHMMHVLMKRYQFVARQRIIPSTIMLLDDRSEPPSLANGPRQAGEVWRLGHISNLWVAKGLPDVIETFVTLKEQGYNVELILAGPVREQASQDMIDACQEKYPGLVDYRGPVYEEEKKRFFEDMDVMLFPSRNEAQPVVIGEAFDYGKPVLAFSLACIPSIMGENREWITPLTSNFVEHASKHITSWMNDDTLYQDVCLRAHHRATELRQEARESLDKFTDWVGDSFCENEVAT